MPGTVKPSVIALSDEALAASPPELVTFTMDDARRIARLAFLITCEAQRRAHPLAPRGPRWEELPPERQAASAAGVVRVLQALMLLGWVDPPEVSELIDGP
jgi:hypothetical protein